MRGSMEAKTVSASKVSIIHHVMPNETNETGKMHGGEMLKRLDSAAAICAFRHARGQLVTAVIEHMEFIAPVNPGDILNFHCSVNYVGRTSMEVGVRIEAEEYLSGEIRHVSTCYLTFVGIDAEGKPRVLPPLIAETEDEQRRMKDAARRMALSRMGTRKKDSFIQRFTLTQLSERFAMCRMAPGATLPPVPASAFMALTQTPDETCLFIPQSFAPMVQEVGGVVEKDYYCLRVDDFMPYKRIGILASISAVLASASIPIFAVSTASTNYILFPASMSVSTCKILRSVGHIVHQPNPLP